MSVLNELLEYREKYLKRADEKINRTFLSMIDRCIAYMHNAEQQLERERRIQECYGIDQKLLYKILDFPKSVYDKFINFIDTEEICIDDVENLARDIISWERRVTDTIGEYHFLKQQKKFIVYNDVPDEVREIITQMIDEFQARTRIVVSPYLSDEDDPDEIRIECLRAKYIKYLFDKYDNRRN